MKRRFFLAAATAASATRVIGANDRIRGGIIGSGGRGRYLTAQYKEIGVDMAAVCDVYEPNLEAGLKKASSSATPYHNYKKLLDDKSLDVVVIATPDHWHSRMAVDAVKAGKDVYLEKPMAHTIEEGFDIINATRRQRRIVQIGTQRRSSDFFIEATTHMNELGPVHLITSQWLNYWDKLRNKKLAGKLDWKQWIGSAPMRPEDPLRFFNWYFFWDYSGGLLIGQAAHIVDAFNMFMKSNYPTAVTCTGENNVKGAQVPETASISIEYPGYLGIFTVGYKAMHYRWYNDQIKQFHGEQARFDVAREWYKLWPQSDEVFMKPSREVSKPGSFEPATRSHIRNFLDCVRSREDPHATVEMGQWTNVVLCMAMESLRTGRRITYDPRKRKMEA